MDIQRIQQALENHKRCLDRFMLECQVAKDQITIELAHINARQAMTEIETQDHPARGDEEMMEIAASQPVRNLDFEMGVET